MRIALCQPHIQVIVILVKGSILGTNSVLAHSACANEKIVHAPGIALDFVAMEADVSWR